MQHQYPFCVLQFEMDGSDLDVNVHPTKMELRFSNQQTLYDFVFRTVREGLERKEYIPQVTVEEPKKPVVKTPVTPVQKTVTKTPVTPVQKPVPKPAVTPIQKPETLEPAKKPVTPQERNLDYFLAQMRERVKVDYANREKKENKSPYQQKFEQKTQMVREERPKPEPKPEVKKEEKPVAVSEPQQMELFDKKLLAEESIKEHKIIGQLFDTYWLVEFDEKLFIIDQHAAHEKVLYERTLKGLKNKEHTSQMLKPPMVISLSMQEEALLKKYMQQFTDLGYEIEHFGGMEYQICAVPGNLYNINKKELFIEILDNLNELSGRNNPELILEKIASMSCKAAVKGNMKLSRMEMESLIKELLTLDNPYQCPHGRPTIISKSKYEIEKKFKRIV